MRYYVYYGEITEENIINWSTCEKPYAILKKNNPISGILPYWDESLSWADTHFSDRIQVDWGSFAWKCCGQDLLEFNRAFPKTQIDGIDGIDRERLYGVVFIEMP